MLNFKKFNMDTLKSTNLKSSKITSYEIMFCILDSVDIINELNSKIDHKKGDVDSHLGEISKNLKIMEAEIQNLITYWRIFQTKYEARKSK